MANTAKWIAGTNPAGTPLSVLTTGLNSLGNGSASAASSAIDNSANLSLYGIFHLHLASLSPAAGGYVDLYILQSIDGGTTFPSATAGVLRNQPDKLLYRFPLDTTATTAQDLYSMPILLPFGQYKIVLDNNAGVALNASGNTVKLIEGNFNLNG